MSVQGDGTPPDRGSFDKATVDRWQVFGGVASVAALLLSLVGGLRNLAPLGLIAAGVVALLGVGLLYRWSRRPRRTAKGLVPAVVVTVAGVVMAGVLGWLELRPAAPRDGAAQDGATPAAFRTESIRLTAGTSIDFDLTTENGGLSDYRTPQTDLTFDKGLQAGHLVVLEEPPSYRSCTTAAKSVTTVGLDDVAHGSALCVETSEGRWARLVVVMIDGAVFEFDLVVWDKAA
ncbi:hypothetical protein [Saccharothrix luteola]|uniref:hypothetical protein n=1 Tax=Saccharothrix luteola TaxID=2893018 RepID=UPI001E30017F|nr:hypothetical protein [Saccharothrix luteola]MCC8247232.1 hypothetical protein [Saccharothrix luteola]